MHNATPPPDVDLPSTGRLIRSTVISIVAAAAILVTVVLPAEYAIDPTGIGRVLGLTRMGEIKQQLEKEAEEHSALPSLRRERPGVLERLGALLVRPAAAQARKPAEKPGTGWKEEVTFSLEPGQGLEIKLTMKKGAIATYDWAATGGRINFDLHAHANGKTARYARGRGKRKDAGSFTARFDGNHGWFFRNRDRGTIRIVIRLKGDYTAVVRK